MSTAKAFEPRSPQEMLAARGEPVESSGPLDEGFAPAGYSLDQIPADYDADAPLPEEFVQRRMLSPVLQAAADQLAAELGPRAAGMLQATGSGLCLPGAPDPRPHASIQPLSSELIDSQNRECAARAAREARIERKTLLAARRAIADETQKAGAKQ